MDARVTGVIGVKVWICRGNIINPSIIGKVVLEDDETVFEDSEEEVAAIEVLVTANEGSTPNKDAEKENSDEGKSEEE